MALVTIVRGYRAATLVVCGDTIERGSRLRDTMLDQADTLLQFNRKELRGRSTTLISQRFRKPQGKPEQTTAVRPF
jgi:hypothetical protein